MRKVYVREFSFALGGFSTSLFTMAAGRSWWTVAAWGLMAAYSGWQLLAGDRANEAKR